MNSVKKHPTFLKWIYLGFVILIDAFIIVQAALPASESARWSNIFVRFFMNIFNGSGKDTTEVIDVTSLELDYDKEYEYNYLEGYLDNEIVIGKAKKIVGTILPSNATNSALRYDVSDPEVLNVSQNQNYFLIEGLKCGFASVSIYSLDNSIYQGSYNFNVVEAKAPTTYTVKDIDVYEGSLFYLPINVEHSSYYDINKLAITHSEPSITSKSDTYDYLYYASSLGKDTYNVGDKSFSINVKSRSDVILPSFTSIEGKDEVHSKSNSNYFVNVSNEPTSKDVIWTISNTSLASISSDGVLKVNEIKEEKKITITAISLLDSSLTISKEITLKPVTITSFELVIPYYGTHITNMPYMGETGEEIKVWMEDNTGTIGISGVTVSSSDESVAEVYAQGSYIYINCIKEGDTHIVVTSINNPSVSKYIDLQVTIRGVINHDNYLSFSEFVRKSIGHFLLFMVSGIFSYLFVYELDHTESYKDKRRWIYLASCILFGFLLAGLSELIQYFVPTRFGSMKDVGVDTLGYMLGSLLVFGIVYLMHLYRKKKLLKKEDKKE